MQTFEGMFAPVATPFTDDASTVSEVRLARQIRYLSESSVDGFVVNSDCGEFGTLTYSERKSMVELTARLSNGKPFLVHVSSLSTAITLDLTQHAARHGARGVVVMPPFYGLYTAEELVGFFSALTRYGDLPAIVVDPLEAITDEVRAGLAGSPQIVFAQSLQDARKPGLGCYKGLTSSDEFAVGEAICSPLALLRPAQVAAATKGEPEDFAKLIILEETLGRARVSKAGLEALGIDSGPPRPPLKSLTLAVSAALKTLLQG
jgi:dihydrodipicolinate synthase/N-acetylneuraminate lyase